MKIMTKPHFKPPVEAVGEGICDADGIWVLIPARNRFSMRQNIDHAKLTARALNCHDELVAGKAFRNQTGKRPVSWWV